MLAQFQPEQIDQWLVSAGAGLAVLAILVSLAHCLFGYVLFRLSLLVQGAIAGWLLGSAVLIWQIRGDPSHADTVVAGLTCAVLLALAAWFLYRLAAGLAVGFGAWAMAWVFISPQSVPWAWAVGITTGLLAGVVVMICVRTLVIIFTSLGGAVNAVFATLVLVRGSAATDELPWWAVALLIATALGLTIAGAFFQQHTYRAIASRFTPEPQKKGRYGPRTKRPPLAKY